MSSVSKNQGASSATSSGSTRGIAPAIGFAAALACGLLSKHKLSRSRASWIAKNLGGVDEGDESSKPVTERRNKFSENMHKASAAEMFDIAYNVDRQLVDSFSEYPSLLSDEKLALVERSISAVSAALRTGTQRIVVSGSGTSGRIGFYAARKYNALLKRLGQPELFGYTISGGDSAFLLSDELPEDDPQAGVQDLRTVCGGDKPCLIIGITCGLSAPYCAGQVDFVLDKIAEEERSGAASSGYSAILMGFNPAELARNVTIERWADRRTGSKTVRDVVLRVADKMSATAPSAEQRAVLLNPIIGPELVCASSRMKGGSIALILLETIFTRAILEVFGEEVGEQLPPTPAEATTAASASSIIQAYSACIDETYSAENKAVLAPLLDLACNSLGSGGHLYWIGERTSSENIVAGAGNGGVLALIDQSEMPDTYGCPFSDIRGFVPDSWTGLQNVEGDLSGQSGLHRIGVSHFVDDVVPTIGSHDVVVVVLGANEKLGDDTRSACELVLNAGGRVALLAAFDRSQASVVLPGASVTSEVRLSRVHLLPHTSSFADLALKMALNVVSSAMQVPCGRIYRNLMINFSPSNDKIYNRCIHQVAVCAKCSRAEAEYALIRAIRKTDTVSISVARAPKSEHICIATPQTEAEKLEPQTIQATAILLASKKCSTFKQAEALLRRSGNRVPFDEL